jgi:hypothetical protein
MIGYILISVLYCATFIAFMKTKENDESYVDRYGDWEAKYILLCLLGTALWPLIIPFIIFYKLAFKILNKTNKTK